ncbi:MAG: hypothetical protein NTY77_20580 [Elusimicrobia bacterium]|nr:hypothetical protein [Elusimicrobiota bacterium]
MVPILLILALVPFLSLVPIHWFVSTGERNCLRKAFWFAFSGSVFWALLGAYLSTLLPAWTWFSYLLLLGGSSLSAACMFLVTRDHFRKLKAELALLTFAAVFLLTQWLVPGSTWSDINGKAVGSRGFSLLRSLH